jgi:hypothetical protein
MGTSVDKKNPLACHSCSHGQWPDACYGCENGYDFLDLPPSPRPAPIPMGEGGGGISGALVAIIAQHAKNAERWGGHKRNPANHLLIATEELGEVARAMQTDPVTNAYAWPPEYNTLVYHELVDLAAVIVAMMIDCEADR